MADSPAELVIPVTKGCGAKFTINRVVKAGFRVPFNAGVIARRGWNKPPVNSY